MARKSRLTWRQVVGSICAVAAVAMTVVAGLVGPSKPVAIVILAVVAGTFQLASAWTFRGQGKADPTLASAAVRRLVGLAVNAAAAKTNAEVQFETNPPKADMHAAMGLLSRDLSWIEDGVIQSIEDWKTFHPAVVQEIRNSSGETKEKGSHGRSD